VLSRPSWNLISFLFRNNPRESVPQTLISSRAQNAKRLAELRSRLSDLDHICKRSSTGTILNSSVDSSINQSVSDPDGLLVSDLPNSPILLAKSFGMSADIHFGYFQKILRSKMIKIEINKEYNYWFLLFSVFNWIIFRSNATYLPRQQHCWTQRHQRDVWICAKLRKTWHGTAKTWQDSIDEITSKEDDQE